MLDFILKSSYLTFFCCFRLFGCVCVYMFVCYHFAFSTKSCLTDPNDELESAEYLGMNVYLHCVGNLQSIDQIDGFTTLLSDFESFQLNIPVLLTEFGCISPSFPSSGTYLAQRDWLQVDALFADTYEAEFAGGFVFEYNTELVNSLSPYPFTEYGAGNFGVGYFTPPNCDVANVTCDYVPFPQFDTLASKYGSVDMTKGPSMDSYVPSDRPYTQCPDGFPLQSSFQWPAMPDLACPEDLTVICPNIPDTCNTPTHPKSSNAIKTSAPGNSTTKAPVSNRTASPTAVLVETKPPSSDSPTSNVRTPSPSMNRTASRPVARPTGEKNLIKPSRAPVKPSRAPVTSPTTVKNKEDESSLSFRPTTEEKNVLKAGAPNVTISSSSSLRYYNFQTIQSLAALFSNSIVIGFYFIILS